MAGADKVRVANGDAIANERDICPVCKSNRISNPQLRFKVSSKCYHRVCEGCIDRRFASGKNPCPIEHCGRQLWKRDWRVQTFEDLHIEREVDLRRAVMKTLDRQEDEFESKRDWDDFLEMREEMIMNLALGTDEAATRRKLKEYEQANAPANRGGPIKRDDSAADPSGLIRGLKKVVAPVRAAPYDPFMGMATRRDYYELREDYPSRYDKFKTNDEVVAGGFDFQQFWDESLLRAFAGLGCFIEDEMKEKQEKEIAATMPMAQAVSANPADDVF